MSQAGLRSSTTNPGGEITIETGLMFATSVGGVFNFAEGGGITITESGNTVTFTASSAVPETFVADSGSATPIGNILNILGSGSVTTIGSGNTITTELTGLTNHAVLVGAGTTTITKILGSNNTVLLGHSGSDPSFGPVPNASLVNSTITLSNGNNITVTGSPVSLGGTASFDLTGTTNHAIQSGNASGSLTSLTVGTNGQVLIGATAANAAFATLTSTGGTITFTTGANSLNLEASTSVATTYTTDSGTATPALNNLNVLGNGSITTLGSGSTITTELTGLTNHAVLVGAGTTTITKLAIGSTNTVLLGNTAADPSFGQVPNAALVNSSVTLSSGNNITVTGGSPLSLGGTATIAVTGTTTHAVQIGNASGSLTSLSVGTNGQVLIAATTADPAFATLTSSDSSISFTTGANTLSLQVAGGSTAIKTITGNSGGAESPSAGNFNILGTGSITVAGSANTETVQLTGITNHAIQIGAGTATLTQLGAGTTGQVLQTNTTADPTWSTATYPSTTTINQILYSSSANVVGGLATANNGVLTTGTSGIPVITALASNGQLIIGSGSGAPAAATLSAGTGITITNGANSITISTTSAGFTWTDVTSATQTLAAENGYITDRAGGVTYTLPASGALGDTIKIIGKLGLGVITPNANQQILLGSTSGLAGATGTCSSQNVGDCIELICITSGASTIWRASSMGTWVLVTS